MHVSQTSEVIRIVPVEGLESNLPKRGCGAHMMLIYIDLNLTREVKVLPRSVSVTHLAFQTTIRTVSLVKYTSITV